MIEDDLKKLIFVSVWFSFAFTLFLLNRHANRRTFDKIQDFGTWQVNGIYKYVAKRNKSVPHKIKIKKSIFHKSLFKKLT